jgi:branched-chain amino acid transport system permease protein
MTIFLQQIIEGLSLGSIYASLALAITLIHRSTGVANFAQGEMAMLSTYIAWQLMHWGVPVWVAVIITLAVSFAMGATFESTVMRRVQKADLLTIVIVTFGLFLIINSGAGLIWSYVTKTFESPIPAGIVSVGELRITYQSIGTMAVLIAEVLILWFIFQHTKLGLAMRAVSINQTSSELVGIPVGMILMAGWGLAGVLGAVAGILVAPKIFLEPNMMGSVLMYAFAAAALGGINSPIGAVVGSLIVGIVESLAGTYVPWVGSDLKIMVPLLLIVATLIVKPSGLFEANQVERV